MQRRWSTFSRKGTTLQKTTAMGGRPARCKTGYGFTSVPGWTLRQRPYPTQCPASACREANLGPVRRALRGARWPPRSHVTPRLHGQRQTRPGRLEDCGTSSRCIGGTGSGSAPFRLWRFRRLSSVVERGAGIRTNNANDSFPIWAVTVLLS